MAIYACGVLAGGICAWLIAKGTFGHDRELKAASVSVFGLRAPLGIFLAGSLACGFATSLWQMILFRVVQGLSGESWKVALPPSRP